MAAMRFQQVQRFILAKKNILGLGHLKIIVKCNVFEIIFEFGEPRYFWQWLNQFFVLFLTCI